MTLLRKRVIEQVATHSVRELVLMLKANKFEGTEDQIWAEEIYSQLTRAGFNSDGSVY